MAARIFRVVGSSLSGLQRTQFKQPIATHKEGRTSLRGPIRLNAQRKAERGETNMAGPQIPKDFRRVIIAAAVGNVIEWYDFYIFGSLAAILSVKFFEQSNPVAALLSTIALFTAGFLIRPLGAFLFGWMGDRIGRKYTF